MSMIRMVAGILLLATASAPLPGSAGIAPLPGTAASASLLEASRVAVASGLPIPGLAAAASLPEASGAAEATGLLVPGTASADATASWPPLPWGVDGHVMAARAALAGLPGTMPAFFRGAGPQLEYLSPEPDRWRTSEFREMDEAWKYDHYIDLENVPSGALDAPDRFEFIKALLEAGIQRPQQDVGFLPFRILEVYQRLVTGFARWRVTPDGPERGWIQERIIFDAGILSHYVVDAAQPHHTTIHFNGWAQEAPNPRGFTADRGFHSRFESAFVRAHIAPGEVGSRVTRAPRELGDVRAAVWEYIRGSNASVERLYELEKEHGFRPDAPAHPEARAFAVQRLVEGAEMLRAVWWTAWQESEGVADRQRGAGERP
jgi:hypothetical protein